MGFIRSFIPWIIFFILNSYQLFFLGALLGLGFYIFSCIRNPHTLYVLDHLSAFFLMGLLMMIEFFHVTVLKNYTGTLGNGFLALYVFITIVINRPFTLSYAKKITPPEKWNSPHFLKINRWIAIVWLLYFFLSLPIMFFISDQHPIDSQILQWGLLLIAVVLTKKIPQWYLKAMGPKPMGQERVKLD